MAVRLSSMEEKLTGNMTNCVKRNGQIERRIYEPVELSEGIGQNNRESHKK